MRICQELGVQLHELLGWPGPMTDRQYHAWVDWLVERGKVKTPLEQMVSVIAKVAWGIEFEEKIPAPVPTVKDDGTPTTDLHRSLSGIESVVGDLSAITGGDVLVDRINRLKKRGMI